MGRGKGHDGRAGVREDMAVRGGRKVEGVGVVAGHGCGAVIADVVGRRRREMGGVQKTGLLCI